MKMSMKKKARAFDEVLEAAQYLRHQNERLIAERDELKKELTLTKLQLEEAWEQIK